MRTGNVMFGKKGKFGLKKETDKSSIMKIQYLQQIPPSNNLKYNPEVGIKIKLTIQSANKEGEALYSDNKKKT